VGFFLEALDTDTELNITLIDKASFLLRTIDLYKNLQSDSTQIALRNASILTWNVGGNEFIQARFDYKDGRCGGRDNQDCYRQAEADIRTYWPLVIEEILNVLDPERQLILTMDIYNPFISIDIATDSWTGEEDCVDHNEDGVCNDFEVLLPYFRSTNAFLAEVNAEHNIPMAQVAMLFNGPNDDIDPSEMGWIALDGIHPNTEGHRQIGLLLSELGYAPVWPPTTMNTNDQDGDGVPDDQDACPNFAGSADKSGC
jgi:lysophospholipase L1-like esterase